MEKEIKKLQNLLTKYIELNKMIVDQQAIAVVLSKKVGNIPVSDLDYEEDFIFFCFTKFTKSMIAIETLIESDLYEDALNLTRSNYECLINAKAVTKSDDMLDQLIDYKLGLNGEKKYRHAFSKKGNPIYNKVVNIHTLEEDNLINIKGIADKAEEEVSYNNVYSFLSEITHCNFLTSGYYREGIDYSYSMVNEIALVNTLLWNVYFNIKFYGLFIDEEVFDIEDLEKHVLSILLSDTLKVAKILEDEEKRVENEAKKLQDQDEIDQAKQYINRLVLLRTHMR
ncbi:DUF5677 domain-containing protein [Alkalihalobacillus sp. TS-13]|uniref:DUF5677 domain-containing protein n=1 Tax=Alkalihalobacillus sp. TS-13 TaxID=2842455 RepID=UPI001C86AE8F|nr:DUF5677 domain-containing protein [Alkalihalobacillus sp. TS-13]